MFSSGVRALTDLVDMLPKATVQPPVGLAQVEMLRVDAGYRILPIG